MLITLVSQCEKHAIKRSQKILDAFANRIGDRTWQTVITEEGLTTLHKQLRHTASKNTAVSCHLMRGRSRSDLLWIVGKRERFNHAGYVPVNHTTHNLAHQEWENQWQYAAILQIVSTLAALLHDIGKSTAGFQSKLHGHALPYGDPYRHEWLSLQLFARIITDSQSDNEWLTRCLQIPHNTTQSPWSLQITDQIDISTWPPLAQWIGWLIVSHHRLPGYEYTFDRKSNTHQQYRTDNQQLLQQTLRQYYQSIRAVNYWVKNPKSIGDPTATDFWHNTHNIFSSPIWQKTLKRWAQKALDHPTLISMMEDLRQQQRSMSDPWLLHLSRLALMVGDHNYSSLTYDDPRCQRFQPKSPLPLAANTLPKGTPKQLRDTRSNIRQSLEEHLLGVASMTAEFARLLPQLNDDLPRLSHHKPFNKPTNHPRFKWQNKAYELAQQQQKLSTTHGFFGINMASTGCGKTIANARIMYGLADPKRGARFTIALGLRILTLQTGTSLRQKLQLDSESLAILVGGQANKALFEIEQNNEQNYNGSESAQDPVDEFIDSDILGGVPHERLGTVIASDKARALLFSPIVTCTIDHLIQASECRRGGAYIAPLLRLLSSDLVLDEPDDFDQNDLPALTRLVHLAGIMGSRILLSSATMTPDMLQGLFEAYQSGRYIWNNSQNLTKAQPICAWIDEYGCHAEHCTDTKAFARAHQTFATQRAQRLNQAPVRRIAEILPLTPATQRRASKYYQSLAAQLLDGVLHLHQNHHQTTPQGQKVSVGLMRMANIRPLNQIALALYQHQSPFPADTIVHLCVYHGQQILILRNDLERSLDRILTRNPEQPEALFNHLEIRERLQSNQATNHIFIVLATAVAEVGRDHDYDWALVEPSSMRSIIQLAGRVWRHRPDKTTNIPNLLIWQRNHKAQCNDDIVFTKPGFEDDTHRLKTHDLEKLLRATEKAHINATPRIVRPPNISANRLSDLEHQVMQDLLNNPNVNYVNAWWRNPDNAQRALCHLSSISPFRTQNGHEQDWIIIPNANGFDVYLREEVLEKGLSNSATHNLSIHPEPLPTKGGHILPWLVQDIDQSLERLQTHYPELSRATLAIRFASVTLRDKEGQWLFHPWLGFRHSQDDQRLK